MDAIVAINGQIFAIGFDFAVNRARGAIHVIGAVFGIELDLDFERIVRNRKTILGQATEAKHEPASFGLIDALDELTDGSACLGSAGKNDPVGRHVIISSDSAPGSCTFQFIAIGNICRRRDRFKIRVRDEIDFLCEGRVGQAEGHPEKQEKILKSHKEKTLAAFAGLQLFGPFAGGDDLGVHAREMESAAITAMFHLHALVDDHGESGGEGAFGGGEIDEP
jgi:hypothetical protein